MFYLPGVFFTWVKSQTPLLSLCTWEPQIFIYMTMCSCLCSSVQALWFGYEWEGKYCSWENLSLQKCRYGVRPVSRSPGLQPGEHTDTHTHTQTKALVVSVQCNAHMGTAHTKLTSLPGRQVKNESAATGFQGRGAGFTLSTPPSLSPRLAR